jgi:hypothetical protein
LIAASGSVVLFGNHYWYWYIWLLGTSTNNLCLLRNVGFMIRFQFKKKLLGTAIGARSTALTVLTASVMLAANPAQAATVALDWNPGGTELSSAQTRGWSFNTSIPINITDLGYYDCTFAHF